jgi:predicted phosphodiesterase
MDRCTVRFLRKQRTLQARFPLETFEALRATFEALRSDNLEFLAGLPRQRALVIDGIPICLCHGTPASQTDGLFAADDLTRFRRLRERANAAIVICGRTHKAFSRLVDDALFVNPGAVGVPVGKGSTARYAVINTETLPWRADLHHIQY